MKPTHHHPLSRALAGAGALVLAMGVGRFAYTALLPSLQRGLAFDDAAAGAIASANLAGYLAGVVWARGALSHRTLLLRLGLLGSVLTTAGVAAATGFVAWVGLRFLSGVASGLVFVLVSTAVLEALPAGKEHLAGILFAGVGAGIALSGAVAAGAAGIAWFLPWLVLGGMSAALAVPAWGLVRSASLVRPAEPPVPEDDRVSLGRLGAAYFLDGFGYIVSGTFAVAAVQRTPGLEPLAPWVWVAAGVAAAPAAIVWSALARRTGARRALAWAFGLQALGMSLPALSPSPWAALAGALFFGGTFMGIVTLTMSLGRRLRPGEDGRVIGTLTMVYGIGQAMAPYLAGRISRATGGPTTAVLAASLAVGLGGALLARRPARLAQPSAALATERVPTRRA